MAFVAREPLRWGDGDIQPGEPVPSGEAGRDYDGMLRLGQIAEHVEIANVEKLQKRLDGRTELAESLAAERDDAVTRAEAAEKAVAEANDAVTSAQAALAAAEKAIAEANDTIAAKDARIADLEQDVEALSAPATPAAPAEQAPEPKRAAAKKPAK